MKKCQRARRGGKYTSIKGQHGATIVDNQIKQNKNQKLKRLLVVCLHTMFMFSNSSLAASRLIWVNLSFYNDKIN